MPIRPENRALPLSKRWMIFRWGVLRMILMPYHVAWNYLWFRAKQRSDPAWRSGRTHAIGVAWVMYLCPFMYWWEDVTGQPDVRADLKALDLTKRLADGWREADENGPRKEADDGG